MKPILFAITFLFFFNAQSQVSSYEEIDCEFDSIKTPYKPTDNNYVLIKSKRGNSGVKKTEAADAILNSEVTEIVLVYSETEAGDLAEREVATQERWDNLILTYPELFQFSTTFKTICQCKLTTDDEAFKKSQGFYVYINGKVPEVAEKAAEPEAPVVKETPPPAPKAPAAASSAPAVSPAKEVATEVVAASTAAAVVATPAASKESPAKVAEKEEHDDSAEEITEEVKTPVKKKVVASAKPRRSKNPKACRPACYGYGDDDLHQFFKDNLVFSKKQLKKAKKWTANVRIQINFDGTIKKAFVTGTEPTFNLQVEEAIKGMNKWNCAVKNGLASKSEVRFILQFDKESKSMKPTNVMSNPKASPKCQCVSDSEIFDE